MTRRYVRRLLLLVSAAFLLPLIALAWWGVVRAGTLDRSPTNVRSALDSPLNGRGRILDRNGAVLAEDVRLPNGTLVRHYTTASLAQVIGYVSPTYGLSGLEQTDNGVLTGTEPIDPLRRVWYDVARLRPAPYDLRLTIDLPLQHAADAALGNRAGAIVVLDAHTGAVLAMVSKPDYDPNQLDQLAPSLLRDPSHPLLNRATQGLFVPGSVFKTITASAALDTGAYQADARFSCTEPLYVQGFRIGCENAPPGGGSYDFALAYGLSVNRNFAQIALTLGWNTLADYTHRFLVGQSIPFDIETAAGRLTEEETPRTPVLLANTGFGQGQILVTPLNMALIAATVADGGRAPHPYLVDAILRRDGSAAWQHTTQWFPRAISAATAADLRSFMRTTVTQAWGKEAAVPGVAVGGKTGTAETGDGQQTHAWFTGIAPVQDPQVVIAVLAEHGGIGATVAAPIAGQVLRAYFHR